MSTDPVVLGIVRTLQDENRALRAERDRLEAAIRTAIGSVLSHEETWPARSQIQRQSMLGLVHALRAALGEGPWAEEKDTTP